MVRLPSILAPYADILKLLLAVALACLLIWAGHVVLDWRDAHHAQQQAGRDAHSIEGIIVDGSRSLEERQRAEEASRTAREEFENTTQEDRRREPQTATRDTGRVPDSRLRAFEQRRIARERAAAQRLERAGYERERGSDAQDPAER